MKLRTTETGQEVRRKKALLGAAWRGEMLREQEDCGRGGQWARSTVVRFRNKEKQLGNMWKGSRRIRNHLKGRLRPLGTCTYGKKFEILGSGKKQSDRMCLRPGRTLMGSERERESLF